MQTSGNTRAIACQLLLQPTRFHSLLMNQEPMIVPYDVPI